MNRWRLLGVLAPLVAAATLARAEEPTTLPALVVTATRTPLAPDRAPFATERLTWTPGTASSVLTVDDRLRASAAFALFRRGSSLTTHPTAQGVSLRGLGPSGASRSLVLLDGVPLNDPFGGWIAWAKLPRLSLAGAEIVRGGGSGVWGNGALGGVVQLFTETPRDAHGAAALHLGDASTRVAEVATAHHAGTAGILTTALRLHSTQGHVPSASPHRGIVDRPLDSRHRLASLGYTLALRPGWRLAAEGHWFDEARGNGTPYQRNGGREAGMRFRLAGPLGEDANLELLGYFQRNRFSSTFSAVAADRASEVPTLDQFAVPASAVGAAVVVSRRGPGGGTTSVGADWRRVSGETREDLLFLGGAFQRRRFAGGVQATAGAFLAHNQPLGPEVDLFVGLRQDLSLDSAGHRREHAIATGELLRDDRFPSRRGTEFSPSTGLVWRVGPPWRLRAAVARGFRVPTLNEYYRPFRVGTVATEANPALRTENVDTVDLGLTYTAPRWEISGGCFHNTLRDAVANVTLSTAPSLTQRQRRNLDDVRVQGGELRLSVSPTPALRLSLDYLHADTRVRRARVAPPLEGKRLAQVPRHTIALEAEGRWSAALTWRATVRALSAQFEDDENRLPLAPVMTADLGVEWMAGPGTYLALSVENVGDVRAEISRSVDGRVTVGPPRRLAIALRRAW